ncbi:MAG: L-threonylcarbamoyladenylate synthase [Candidatus Uhrbacteria bacterium]|nr:L-threonylcarbamoyladenylate synthase [Candidatus Uhrbacteria bacterium]
MPSKTFHSLQSAELVMLLKCGAIGVIPTDTIYGISASAVNKEAIERLYDIRNRDRSKPFIVLISSIDDLDAFGISLKGEMRKELLRIWPAPVSVVLTCHDKKYAHLHRGVGSIAFRVPAWAQLRTFLKRTGPLVTTSVNPEGKKPAITVKEARSYFGDILDFYVDVGSLRSTPSTLLRLAHDGFEVLRRGGYATEFQKRIYDVVKNIPKGSTLTYKEVAKRAGSPRAYRAVGNILSKNYDPSIPCHRVIRSDGKTGGYNRGEDRKQGILRAERKIQ